MSAVRNIDRHSVAVERCLVEDMTNMVRAMRATAALIEHSAELPPRDHMSGLFEHYADDLDEFIRKSLYAV